MDALMKKAGKGAAKYVKTAAKMTPLGMIVTTVQHKTHGKKEKKDTEQVEEPVDESKRELEGNVGHYTEHEGSMKQGGNTQYCADETDWEDETSDEEGVRTEEKRKKKKKKRNNAHRTIAQSNTVDETSKGVNTKSQFINNTMSFLDSKKLKELMPKDIKKHIPKNIKEFSPKKNAAGERSSTATTPTASASGSPSKKNGKSMTSRATEFITSEKSKKMGKDLWKKKDTMLGIAQRFMK